MIRAHESTTNVLSGHNVRDVEKGIHWLDPDAAPLTAIITRAATRKYAAKNPKFEWNEKGNAPKADLVSGAITTGETALVVDNPSYFGVNDIVKVGATGELLRVTAVSTGNSTLTVTRSVGPTTASTIANDANLLIVGNAWAEGAAKGTPRSHQETTPFNYTQIFRHQFGQTNTQMNTDSYVGDGRTELRMEKGREHKIDIERAFHFGERDIDSTDTAAPIRYTGGLLYFGTSNALAAGGTLTESELETWLASLFTYTGGGPTRLLLASPTVISVLDQIAASRMQVVSGRDQNYGLSLKSWITSHGDLLIVKDRLLTDAFAGYAFAVDPTKLAYTYLQNRDTVLNKNIEDQGDDRWTDEYLSEVGLKVSNPETMGVASGITG